MLYFLLSLLFFSSTGFAQNQKNTINFGITPSYLLLKDEVLSPMINRGSGYSLSLDYQRTGEKSTWKVGLNFNDFNEMSTQNVHYLNGEGKFSILYGSVWGEYLVHLHQSEKITWKVGLNNTNIGNYRQWSKLFPQISNAQAQTSQSYFFTFQLKTANEIFYKPKPALTLSNYTNFNLFNYVLYQQQNSVSPLVSGFVLPNQVFDFQNELRCEYQLSSVWYVGASYYFNWFVQAESLTANRFAMVQHGFKIQNSFKW